MAGKFKQFNKRKADLLYIGCQSPKFRKTLLQHADKELIRCICQCASRVLSGDVPIQPHEKSRLQNYKGTLRQLRDNRKTLSKKKKIIVQSGGGFLLSLIPAVIGALASLIR